MNPKAFFVTGTDTDVGKTYVSVGLLKAFASQGFSTLGLKPIASDCESIDNKLFNADARALQAASTVKLSYSDINPFSFQPAISPNIAAELIDVELSVEKIQQKLLPVLNTHADITLIEGVGGLCVPLNSKQILADLIKALEIPVILVVGLRLGCLNHAIATSQLLSHYQIPLHGWFANVIDPTMSHQIENIESLEDFINAPLLGLIEHNGIPQRHSVA